MKEVANALVLVVYLRVYVKFHLLDVWLGKRNSFNWI